MTWLWTWSGSSFGYHLAGELWTYDGHHVGRFHGNEIYGPNGLYLGEVMNEDRLIINVAKTTLQVAGFSQLPKNIQHPAGFGFNKVALPAGFDDFPRPTRFR